jgi:hypothetical protein
MAPDQMEQMTAEDAEAFKPRPPEPESRSQRPPDVRHRRPVDQPRVGPRL